MTTFYHVGSGDQTQVIRLGHKHLPPLSHLAGPWCYLQLLSKEYTSEISCFYKVRL